MISKEYSRYYDAYVLQEIKKYFDIRELVSPIVYRIFGQSSWRFFSIRALTMLLITREILDVPITVNNWSFGGKFTQRGLRSNLGSILKGMVQRGKLYLSAHVLGEAFDFDAEGYTATEVRRIIVANAHKYPFKIRLEKTARGKEIIWVHIDCIYEEKNPNVYLFAA